MADLRKIVKAFLPPVLLELIRKPSPYGFFGNYRTWSEALADATGYDAPIILERVRLAARKVKSGEVAFERDGMVFKKPQYTWPVLAFLLWVASRNQQRLSILDFGGSLGSSYFQHRHFLEHLVSLRWNIVEQPQFVGVGKQEFEDGRLKFYNDLEQCVSEQKPQIILLSSVLPYLEKPYELLERLSRLPIPYAILDRTPFLFTDGQDRLTVQKVKPEIYPASYPAWFFSRSKFLDFVVERYNILAEFDCPDRANIPASYKGLILEKRAQP